MSVTFYAELSEPVGFTLTCERAPEMVRTYDEALTLRAVHSCGDEDCAVYGTYTQPVYADAGPEVNMANANARDLLDTLGLPSDDDLCGSVSADDFLGRVLVALAVAPADEGFPTYALGLAEGGPRMFRGGRPAGYVQARLEALRDVAEHARSRGKRVVYA